MVKATLEKRVEMLEETVGGRDGVVDRLGRVEVRLGAVETEVQEFRGEFLQFRDETRGEFSAVRGEMAVEFANVRSEMAAGFASVRSEMADGFASVRGEMATKQDMAETRSQMRALHEEVIGRIALLQEAQSTARARTPRPRKTR